MWFISSFGSWNETKRRTKSGHQAPFVWSINVLVVLPTGFGESLIFQLFVKILARNSSSTCLGRSAIVICPLESIILDHVLEAQSIGVTACSLSAKNLSEVCENTPQLLFAKAEDVQNPVQNSKFQLPAIFWLVHFPAKIMGAERNIPNGIVAGFPSFPPPVPSPPLPSPPPNPRKPAMQAISSPEPAIPPVLRGNPPLQGDRRLWGRDCYAGWPMSRPHWSEK